MLVSPAQPLRPPLRGGVEPTARPQLYSREMTLSSFAYIKYCCNSFLVDTVTEAGGISREGDRARERRKEQQKKAFNEIKP